MHAVRLLRFARTVITSELPPVRWARSIGLSERLRGWRGGLLVLDLASSSADTRECRGLVVETLSGEAKLASGQSLAPIVISERPAQKPAFDSIERLAKRFLWARACGDRFEDIR